MPVPSWPDDLKEMLAEGDVLGLTAKREYQLAMKSLGAIVWYFKRCLIDAEILSMGNISTYVPPEVTSRQEHTSELTASQRKMIIDGVSLNNLEILCNSAGTSQGTLYDKINFCNTAIGIHYSYMLFELLVISSIFRTKTSQSMALLTTR